MSREEILHDFATAMSDPGSYKSGEYLLDHLVAAAASHLEQDRDSVIQIISEWLMTGTPAQFSWSLVLARKLGLRELVEEIKAQKLKVEQGKKLNQRYIFSIERALDTLK